MRAPRYGSRSLTEVLPSVVGALQAQANPLAIPPLSQAVVVVIDGLGYEQLHAVADDLPTLGPAVRAQAPLDAAFPTTTPAGIASITLGLPPGRHGLVGATFELPDFGQVLNPLHWEQDPAPAAVQPEPNVFAGLQGIQARSHGPVRFATSGMTRTLLGSAEQCGYERFDPAVITAADARLDYVYLPELDKIGHGEGPFTPSWRRCLQGMDALVRRLLERVPANAGLLLTSDHGMVTVPDDRRVDVDDPMLQAGVRLLAGEPRMRHVYCDDADEVRTRWARELGERVVVLLRREAIDLGLFGDVDDLLAERIGDVIAIAQDDWALTSSTVDPKPSGLRGMHGALTDAELLVPCLLMPGVA